MGFILNKKELAETYKRYQDPISTLKKYKKSQEMDKLSSYKISRELDLPRERVRQWKNGSKPKFIKSIEVAEENNWINLSYRSKNFKTLNRLVSWIFSAGSIAKKTYNPIFTIKHHQKNTFIKLMDTLGLQYKFIREEKSDKATEARIKKNSSLIGRILWKLGAPRGNKSKKKGSNIT
ncbi:MAG: Inactivated LAGLIDADG family endonuclease and N-terminal HTH domain [Candidatus Methanohalarchaeum thermophilum]|uniref:Inactivated LAGLIDADG family endonuclease and N-terminal HTH domain n=1 Tax=Methanohalarchaeum thermophilum TaxID=1903181 RepID=A0A1Q6DT14_METT1|nr:MAG: Inactivated LAGLIDADG family endonuclease and N-terminal HTH domain [Candidatus Methanohalarchaeum thermophilum]